MRTEIAICKHSLLPLILALKPWCVLNLNVISNSQHKVYPKGFYEQQDVHEYHIKVTYVPNIQILLTFKKGTRCFF